MLYHQVAGARLISLEEAELWDLVFFHRRALAHKVHMISHVGIFVDGDGNYFHSSPKWGKVDNISDSLIKGTIVTCRLALKRTDPR
jgi:cell wall-associated NlpC family hydrolase